MTFYFDSDVSKIKSLQKNGKNPLTNSQTCDIIKMSKGKSKAKIQSVRLEKFLGNAEKSS